MYTPIQARNPIVSRAPCLQPIQRYTPRGRRCSVGRAVARVNCARQHICDGLNAPVRMPRKAFFKIFNQSMMQSPQQQLQLHTHSFPFSTNDNERILSKSGEPADLGLAFCRVMEDGQPSPQVFPSRGFIPPDWKTNPSDFAFVAKSESSDKTILYYLAYMHRLAIKTHI